MKRLLIVLCLLLIACDNSHLHIEKNTAVFEPIVARIERGKAANIHSLLVWQNDRLVLELYREGSGRNGNYHTANLAVGRDVLHNVHSVTKSFVATLIFIAIDEGKIESLDVPIFSFFPEYQASARDKKLNITLRDVMNMSTGFALDELSSPYKQGNIFARHYNAKNLLEQFLSTPLSFEPGTRFAYSGLSTIGLSKVIEKVYEKPFTKVMKEKLFSPLGIVQYQWLTQLGSGEPGADWGLRLTSTDMGKFGLMWMHKGEYAGKRVVGNRWFDELRLSQFTGYEMGYGLHFWQVSNVNNAVAAVGIGEQYIMMLPSKNAVIVATAGNYDVGNRPVLQLTKELAELL